jgi:hypothetical protein
MSKAGVKSKSGSCRGKTHTGTTAYHFLETVVIFAKLFAQVEKFRTFLTTAEKSATSVLHRKEK